MGPVFVLFMLSFLAGSGGTAGYLWHTKPAATAAEDSAPMKTEKPANFTWIDASSSGKSKDEGK